MTEGASPRRLRFSTLHKPLAWAGLSRVECKSVAEHLKGLFRR